MTWHGQSVNSPHRCVPRESNCPSRAHSIPPAGAGTTHFYQHQNSTCRISRSLQISTPESPLALFYVQSRMSLPACPSGRSSDSRGTYVYPKLASFWQPPIGRPIPRPIHYNEGKHVSSHFALPIGCPFARRRRCPAKVRLRQPNPGSLCPPSLSVTTASDRHHHRPPTVPPSPLQGSSRAHHARRPIPGAPALRLQRRQKTPSGQLL